ncbi:unnamed protein product, partial [Staurois parvus]
RLSAFLSPRPVTLTADHQGTDDQCALIICVAPAAPPVISASSQCSSMQPASAHQCQISVPHQCHINAHLSCLSVSPTTASQCHQVLPVSGT